MFYSRPTCNTIERGFMKYICVTISFLKSVQTKSAANPNDNPVQDQRVIPYK